MKANLTFHSDGRSIISSHRLRIAGLLSSVVLIISSCDPGLQSEQVYDIDAETVRVTQNDKYKVTPSWSPSGQRIAYIQLDYGTIAYQVCICGDSREVPIIKDDDYYEDLTLSPDGSRIVYRSRNTGHLTVRSLTDEAETILAPEVAWPYNPVWSPDGQLIAFNAHLFESGNLFIVSASGGEAQALIREERYTPYCGGFSSDGKRIAFHSSRSGNPEIWTITLDSGELQQLTFPPRNKLMPVFSPDGTTIAYVSYQDTCSTRESTLWLMASDGSNARQLVLLDEQPDYFSWSPDGRTLAVENSDIYTISIGTGQVRNLGFNGRRPCWFSDGQSLLVSQWEQNYSIYMVSLESLETTKLSDTKIDTAYFPVWLNEDEVAFIKKNVIWKKSISGTRAERLTPNMRLFPKDLEISPDRSHLCFDDGRDIFLQPVTGAPATNLTAHISEPLIDPTWSPDGKQIACRYIGGIKIFALVSGKLVERRAIAGSYGEPSWSPSERFGSYLALRSSGIVLFPLDSPDPEPRLTISNGSNASWSPDGTRLAYVKDTDIYVSRVFDDIR